MCVEKLTEPARMVVRKQTQPAYVSISYVLCVGGIIEYSYSLFVFVPSMDVVKL